MTYTSASGRDGLAVFSEVYYPNGWKAFVDGKETPIIKVNYVLRGLAIPKGEHQIEFRFEPASFTIGDRLTTTIGVLSILVLLYGGFVLYKNSSKRPVTAKK